MLSSLSQIILVSRDHQPMHVTQNTVKTPTLNAEVEHWVNHGK